MTKQGEISYLRAVGAPGIRHMLNKPFSDDACGANLMQIGAVMSLLPPPPARILDVGCGTGWTSFFLARRGYTVVGVDICPDAIAHANAQRDKLEIDHVRFLAVDYEEMTFDEEFDAALFFDSLHHAVDHAAAIQKVGHALKPGGVCITSEPGRGHQRSRSAQEARQQYDVTEKDMPPRTIIEAARRAGFRSFQVYPHARDLEKVAYSRRFLGRWARWGNRCRQLATFFLIIGVLLFRQRRNGMVVMVK